LEDFDWDKYSFNIITIEHPNEKVRIMLMQQGYWFVVGLGEDDLWVNSKLMDKDEARDLIDDLTN